MQEGVCRAGAVTKPTGRVEHRSQLLWSCVCTGWTKLFAQAACVVCAHRRCVRSGYTQDDDDDDSGERLEGRTISNACTVCSTQ